MATSGDGVAQECVEGYLFSRAPVRILLFRRPPARGSIWVPVSGKVEAVDPDWEAALRRELLEETGLAEPRSLVPLDWHFPFDGPDGRRWRLHAYGVEVDGAFVPVLSDEHDAFEWLSPEEAARRLHFEDNREALARLLKGLRPDSGARAPPARPMGRP